MRRRLIGLLVILLLLITASGFAATWADHFPAPEAIGPGDREYPGPILNTLTPELKFITAGTKSIVGVFASDDYGETPAGQFAMPCTPVLLARVHTTSLQIPAGVLLPGKSYYWYVESTYAPGSKSEVTKASPRMYFSTAKAK